MCELSHVWLFTTPWTIVHRAPPSMEFSRQEDWSGLPFPPPGDLPDPGIETTSLKYPALAGRFFTTSATWEAVLKPMLIYCSENPRALKNYVKSTLPVLYKWNNKAWMTAYSFTACFTDYLNCITVEIYCSEKKNSKYYRSLSITWSSKSSDGDV